MVGRMADHFSPISSLLERSKYAIEIEMAQAEGRPRLVRMFHPPVFAVASQDGSEHDGLRACASIGAVVAPMCGTPKGRAINGTGTRGAPGGFYNPGSPA